MHYAVVGYAALAILTVLVLGGVLWMVHHLLRGQRQMIQQLQHAKEQQDRDRDEAVSRLQAEVADQRIYFVASLAKISRTINEALPRQDNDDDYSSSTMDTIRIPLRLITTAPSVVTPLRGAASK